ncbi:MAG: hypothetical protein KKA60_09985 [Proteobacteria bacterium]|nr:hypothetical protein [Pseudomonadota bacterium]
MKKALVVRAAGWMKKRRKTIVLALVCAWALSGLLAWNLSRERPQTLQVPNREITAQGGPDSKAWRVVLPKEIPRGGRQDGFERSRLKVFFNGKALPRPHAPFLDVKNLGGGCYLHFNNILLFSTPGGEDPRAYGNRVALEYPARNHPLAFAVLLGLFTALSLALPVLLGGYARKHGVSWRVVPYYTVLGALGAALVLGAVSRADVFWVQKPLGWGVLVPYSQDVYNSMQFTLPPPCFTLPEPPTMGDLAEARPYPMKLTVNGREVRGPVSMDDLLQNPEPQWLLGDQWILFRMPPGQPAPSRNACLLRYPLRAAPEGMAVLVLMMGILLVLRRKLLKGPGKEILLLGAMGVSGLGVFLLTLNLLGLVIPLRGPEPLPEEAACEVSGARAPLAETLKELERRPGESVEAYCGRAVRAVERGMTGYWGDRGLDRYRTRIPPWENIWMFLESFRGGGYMRRMFINHRRGLERGVGRYVQNAMVLCGFLRENGVLADLVEPGGIVLVRVETGAGEYRLLDPLFGLVIPFDVKALRANAQEVLAAYEKPLSKIDPLVADLLGRTMAASLGYPPEQWKIRDPATVLGQDKAAFEKWAYRIKWPIPFVLILAGLGMGVLVKRRGR